MIEAKIVKSRLSDCSMAYGVHITQRHEQTGDEQTIYLPANSAGDADRIVATVVDLVNRHTAEQAKRTD